MRGAGRLHGLSGFASAHGLRVWRDVASFPTPGAGVGGAFRHRPRRRDLSCRAQARGLFASLHAQGSNGDPRCVADDSLALLAQGGARVCRTPRRMDRNETCAAAATHRLRAARRDAVARRRSSDRASAGRARRRVARGERTRAAHLRFRGAAACGAPHRRFPQARGAQGSRSRRCPPLQTARRQAAPDRAARHREPLGLVLVDRRTQFFLAPRFSPRRSCSTISPRTRWRISCT